MVVIIPLRYKYSSINVLINFKGNTVINFNIKISRKTVNRLQPNKGEEGDFCSGEHTTILPSFIEIDESYSGASSEIYKKKINNFCYFFCKVDSA